jgi:hypothetical protein
MRQMARFFPIPLLTLIFLALFHPNVWGSSDIQIPPTYSQSQFHDFSKQGGLAISYFPLAPAEPLGITGFDIGGEVTLANIDQNESFWKDIAKDNDPPDLLILPKIHVQKGIPFGIDLGIVYSKVPNSNISMIGGEIKWAFIGGNLVFPALALRGSYTTLLGVDDLGMSTYGVDLSISKGISFITPYAGIGEVWIDSKPKSSLVSLSTENISLTKGFVGVKLSLFVVNFVAEADFSTIPVYSARLNFGF